MQPAAFDRYSPRFASPCAAASAAQSRKKSPAVAGPLANIVLLLLAEALVAAAARLADSADLRLDCTLVAALAHFIELVHLILQADSRFLKLIRLLPDRRQCRSLHAHVFGAGIKAVPRHAAQVVEKTGVAPHDIRVVRCLALRHGGERTEVFALQRHHCLALLDEDLGLRLRE